MPKRGNILSESGSIISKDISVYRIYVIPEETKDLNNLIDIITKDLKLRQKTVDRIWRNVKKQQPFQPVLVSENSDWNTLAKLAAKNIPGVHINTGFSRVYEMGA